MYTKSRHWPDIVEKINQRLGKEAIKTARIQHWSNYNKIFILNSINKENNIAVLLKTLYEILP